MWWGRVALILGLVFFFCPLRGYLSRVWFIEKMEVAQIKIWGAFFWRVGFWERRSRLSFLGEAAA